MGKFGIVSTTESDTPVLSAKVWGFAPMENEDGDVNNVEAKSYASIKNERKNVLSVMVPKCASTAVRERLAGYVLEPASVCMVNEGPTAFDAMAAKRALTNV